ncbi:MAG: hypothetical protein HY744_22315 [Deltaproteobacteria bacterium]|nr:hypothetical protein [Deltaproteobacteria bacterium]
MTTRRAGWWRKALGAVAGPGVLVLGLVAAAAHCGSSEEQTSGTGPGPQEGGSGGGGGAPGHGGAGAGGAEPGDAGSEGGSAGGGGGTDAEIPVEFPPDKWGKYLVGVFQADLWDSSRNRLVPIYVWYPAAGQGGKQITYMWLLKGAAWQDAPPAKEDGPFPVALFSHGFKGIAFQSYAFTEYLASHGFVVVAPNHSGNTLFDFTAKDEDVAQVTLDRPKDIHFAYTKAVELGSTPGHVLEGMLDPKRVAMTGHSFGAFTALIVAGAEADMDKAKTACANGVEADIFCPYVGYYPPGTVLRMDPKIAGLRAVVALTPGGYNAIFDENLAKVYVPALVMGGTEDTTTPLDIEIDPIYAGLPKPKAKAVLAGASHMSFTNICSIPMAPMVFGDMCKASLSEGRAFEIIDAIATAFVRLHVGGEAGMKPFLSDPYLKATFPEVAYVADPP